MKLGESGEAFFVEECSENDLNDIPNLATSPIPISMSETTNLERAIGYVKYNFLAFIFNAHVYVFVFVFKGH